MDGPSTLVTLVGEQPIPSLLVARAVGAERVVLVATKRTRAVARRLAPLINGDVVALSEAYRLDKLAAELPGQLSDAGDQITYDLTGGTKPMMLALFAIAGSQNRPFVMLRSNGPASVLSLYRLADGQPTWQSDTRLPTLLTASEYLSAHVGRFDVTGPHHDKETGKLSSGGRYEQAVAEALDPLCDEVLVGIRPHVAGRQIDLDLVIRCGNHVGVAEVKMGGTAERKKAGLDQLAQATEPTVLGSHTKRFLIAKNPLNRGLKDLAQSRRIRVVETPDFRGLCCTEAA